MSTTPLAVTSTGNTIPSDITSAEIGAPSGVETLNPVIPAMIEAMPGYVLVLDQNYRVLAVNRRLLDAFGIEDDRLLLGLKPGEAIHCIHVGGNPEGCGSGRFCQKCAAVMAIVESERLQGQVSREYRVTVDRDEWSALELEVVVSPLQVDGLKLILFAMRDISAEKRRQVLEKVFFHDVINTAGGIKGLAEALAHGKIDDPNEERFYKESMVTLSNKLIDEIVYQRSLVAAEKGEFKPNPGIVEVDELLREQHVLYASHDLAADKNFILGPAPACKIVSDAAILRRILGNLIKNALEATAKGGTVTLSCSEQAHDVTFRVNNPGVMTEDVQVQLFQRSFSTKAAEGRGLGTYSVKLFGERYLKGKVGFTSNEKEGTTFSFTVPKGY